MRRWTYLVDNLALGHISGAEGWVRGGRGREVVEGGREADARDLGKDAVCSLQTTGMVDWSSLDGSYCMIVGT
jgi:hypothetical protein